MLQPTGPTSGEPEPPPDFAGDPWDAVNAAGPWQHRDVHANGMRFHVVEAGTGPLVLMVHGFPSFWWTWREMIRRLSSEGYRAAAMDLRGYGGSDHPPRGYDAFTLSRDIAGVIRSLGEPGAILVGHGTGGLLSWTAAALMPQVVHRLVVVSAPHPVRMRRALLRDRGQRAALSYIFGFQRPWVPERHLTADGAAQVERFLREWSANQHWPTPDIAARFRSAFQIPNTAHCAIEFDRWAMRSIPRPDGRRFNKAMIRARITSPVLQIHGALDRNILPRSAVGSQEFVDAPYSWRLFRDSGHFPHEEGAAEFAETVLAWLRAIPPWSDESSP